MPEEQRPHCLIPSIGVKFVLPTRAGLFQVATNVSVPGIEALRASIVDDRESDFSQLVVRIRKVVVELAVPNSALLDQVLVTQGRPSVQFIGTSGVAGLHLIPLTEQFVRFREDAEYVFLCRCHPATGQKA